jgi:hypothetical protein
MKKLKEPYSFRGVVEKFPGSGGWVYVAVPKKYTNELKKQRRAWGMYPITAHIGKMSWKTKLMMKKGGDFFVALKSAVRDKEKIAVGDHIKLSFVLQI